MAKIQNFFYNSCKKKPEVFLTELRAVAWGCGLLKSLNFFFICVHASVFVCVFMCVWVSVSVCECSPTSHVRPRGPPRLLRPSPHALPRGQAMGCGDGSTRSNDFEISDHRLLNYVSDSWTCFIIPHGQVRSYCFDSGRVSNSNNLWFILTFPNIRN